MTPFQVKKLIEELTLKVLQYNKEYYVNSRSTITDYEYDQLLAKLKTLEDKYPQFRDPNSPTLHVGDDSSSGFVEIKHRVPMQSLENTYNRQDVESFLDKVAKTCHSHDVDYLIECKIDGLSISCRYEQGHLVHAVTRGNGLSGDDVTSNALLIEDIPKIIDFHGVTPDIFEIRGEVFMTEEEFARINSDRISRSLEPLANPRNTASGTLKSLDKSILKERKLNALFYALGEVSPELSIVSQEDMFVLFNRCGIPFEHKYIKAHTNAEVIDAIAEIDRYRHSLCYPTDGAVIKVNRFDQRVLLGATSKCPHWAKAYKFAPSQVNTKILGITIQLGRTGVLTPVAELQPVWLDGTTIRRATLHNEDFIKRMDIRIGDTVTIEKGGEIIPTVVNCVCHEEESILFDFASHVHHKCPVCNGPISRDETEAAWRCMNPNCQGQIEKAIVHLGEKSGLDIEGLGSAVAKALIQTGKILSIVDLFHMEASDFASLSVDGKLLGLNGLKLYESLKHAPQKPLSNWIYAMGIPLVGKSVAYTLGSTYKNLEDFYQNYTSDGSVAGDHIRDYLTSPSGNHIVESLLSLGINPNGDIAQSHALKGKIVVITGVLKHMDRHNAEDALKHAGATVTSAVSNKTNFVIAGNSDGKLSTKAKRAKELGIPILTEDEFLLLLK